MNEIKEIIEKLLEFRDKRNWKQFHNPKDLAINLNIESSELLELFLWKNENEVKNDINIEKIKDELADATHHRLEKTPENRFRTHFSGWENEQDSR